MKIALVCSGPVRELLLYSEVFQLELLGLGYISSCLRGEGHETFIVNQMLDGLSDSEFRRKIIDYKPDLVGLSVTTANIDSSLILGKEIKERSKALVVCGGYYPTPFPEIVRHAEFDLAVMGEGERTMTEIVRRFGEGDKLTGIPGTAWMNGDELVVGEPRERIKDLDTLPFPDRRFSDPEKMRVGFVSAGGKKDRAFSVVTSRGCTLKCGFCASPFMWGGKWIGRTPENVMKELGEIVNEHRINHIFFQDEEINLNRKRALELYRQIREAKLGFAWSTQSSVKFTDLEVAEAMVDAGLKNLYLGYESGAPQVLEKLAKSFDPEDGLKINKYLQKRGVFTSGNFMLGFPWESRETLEQTISFAKDLNLDIAVVIFFRPQPNTEFSDLVVKEGFFDPSTYVEANHNPFTPPMPTYHLSSKEVEKAAGKFMLKVYGRPTYWLRILYRTIKYPERLSAYAQFIRIVLIGGLKSLFYRWRKR